MRSLLSDDLADCLSKRRLISSLQRAELADDQPLLDGCEHRFDGGGFEQTSLLPLSDPHLAERGGGGEVGR